MKTDNLKDSNLYCKSISIHQIPLHINNMCIGNVVGLGIRNRHVAYRVGKRPYQTRYAMILLAKVCYCFRIPLHWGFSSAKHSISHFPISIELRKGWSEYFCCPWLVCPSYDRYFFIRKLKYSMERTRDKSEVNSISKQNFPMEVMVSLWQRIQEFC